MSTHISKNQNIYKFSLHEIIIIFTENYAIYFIPFLAFRGFGITIEKGTF